jgi:hypothetical protein
MSHAAFAVPDATFRSLRELLRPPVPDPAQQLFRLKSIERDIILPISAHLAILVYYFYLTPWHGDLLLAAVTAEALTERFFGIYIAVNAAVAVFISPAACLSNGASASFSS